MTGPFRAAAALLDLYLLRLGSRHAVALVHVGSLLFAAAIASSDDEVLWPGRSAPPQAGRVSLFIGGYLLLSLGSLLVVAASAWARSRWGAPSSSRAPESRRTAGSRVSWLNVVIVVALAVVLAPGMADVEGTSLASGLGSGMCLAMTVRVPGAWAEWRLMRHGRYRAIFRTHVAAAAVALFIAFFAFVVPPVDPAAAPAPSKYPIPDMLAIYLLFASIGMVGVGMVMFVLRRWRPSAPPHEEQGSVAATGADRRTGEPAAPDSRAPSSSAGSHSPAFAADVPAAMNVEAARPTSPVRPHSNQDSGSSAGEGRRGLDQSQVPIALGIVCSVASLVQGYDDAEPYRTGVAALAVGFGAWAVVKLVVSRGDRRSRSD